MNTTIDLIALKSHTLDGSRRYKKGERYPASPAQARMAIAHGLATLAGEEPKTEGRYKRRDLQAEE